MVIGITGGIATGKSTVTRMLHELGAVTFSADEASRAVLTKDGPVLRLLREQFGAGIITSDGSLNRTALAERVFTDSAAREALNSIMHPRIRRLLRDQIFSANLDLIRPGVVAVEIPLLFEGKLESWFERIIVVTASSDIQVKRLMGRSRLTQDEAELRISAQMPLAEKVSRATYVVDNSGIEAALAPQVANLWSVLTNPPTKPVLPHL